MRRPSMPPDKVDHPVKRTPHPWPHTHSRTEDVSGKGFNPWRFPELHEKLGKEAER